VLLVSEVRTVEEARLLLEAAETGHLVLTTVRAFDTASAVRRILALFRPRSARRRGRGSPGCCAGRSPSSCWPTATGASRSSRCGARRAARWRCSPKALDSASVADMLRDGEPEGQMGFDRALEQRVRTGEMEMSRRSPTRCCRASSSSACSTSGGPVVKRAVVVGDGKLHVESALGALTASGFEAVAVTSTAEARAQVEAGATVVVVGATGAPWTGERAAPLATTPPAVRARFLLVLVESGFVTARGSAPSARADWWWPPPTRAVGDLVAGALAAKRQLVAALDPAAAARLGGDECGTKRDDRDVRVRGERWQPSTWSASLTS